MQTSHVQPHRFAWAPTNTKHSFWYINLLNEQDSMYYRNFDQKMLVVDEDDQVPSAATASRNPGQLRALGA